MFETSEVDLWWTWTSGNYGEGVCQARGKGPIHRSAISKDKLVILAFKFEGINTVADIVSYLAESALTECIPIARIYTVLICFYYYYTEILYSPVVIVVYAFCAGEFFVRYLWKRPLRAAESSEYYNDATELKYDLNGRGEMNHEI